jgi:hypothetical protein
MPAVRQLRGFGELAKALSNETHSAFVAAVPAGKALPAGLEKAAKEWMDRHIFASGLLLADLLPQGGEGVPADVSLAVVSQGRHQQWPGKDNTTEPLPAVAFYHGSLDDVDAVSAWVERSRFPGIWQLSDLNFYEFTHANRPAALLADDPQHIAEATEAAFRGAASALSDDFIFGFVDGAGWSEELQDFNIYKKDLPRMFVTESNFEVWVEDIDELRVATATDDLRSLAAGAPLLRQSRKPLSKLFFQFREARRFISGLILYAQKGPTEAGLVAFAALLGLASAVILFWCLYKLFSILLSDPDDYEYHNKMKASDKKSK